MTTTRPINHTSSCGCAVCVKIRSPKSTKVLLTIYIDQHEYMQEYARRVGISTSEAIRKGIDFFREAYPLDKVEKKPKGKTLMEVLCEDGEV